MIRIYCRTNLDLEVADKCGFPEYLPEVPRVGDLLESKMEWTITNPGCISDGVQTHLQLRVCAVIWKHRKSEHGVKIDEWYPEVELTLPLHRFENMIEFYEWYGRATGKGVHAYI